MFDPTLRLYAVVRQDLNMPQGKCAAQAGHAYVNAILQAQKLRPDVVEEYQRPGLGTKICLAAKNLSHIKQVHEQAQAMGIPCSLIVDSGHVLPPHFDGNPIVTALGIGPCTRQEIYQITGMLKLL